jgi:hypothetical protein
LRAISDSAPSVVLTFFSPSALRAVGQPATPTIIESSMLLPIRTLRWMAG